MPPSKEATAGSKRTASGVQSVGEIQAAIRKHAFGEEVRLLVQRGSEEPLEIQVA